MRQPSISETAFNCPHCGAYAKQNWHRFLVDPLSGHKPLPTVIDNQLVDSVLTDENVEPDVKARWHEYRGLLSVSDVFAGEAQSRYSPPLHNIFASHCFNCGRWALWVTDRIVYPSVRFGSQPNADLPAGIAAVMEEARQIVDASPRGAAALLRLAIQMLCIHLGRSGSDLNAAIGSLVSDGLNPIVQKSLDVVRVIGNESVHPGTIDLNDDRDTAIRLFDLVNIICEQMITQPRQVSELYEKLPEDKRKAIERRDNGKAGR